MADSKWLQQQQLNKLSAKLDILYGISLLEYHDKNYLSLDLATSNCARNEKIQQILLDARQIVLMLKTKGDEHND